MNHHNELKKIVKQSFVKFSPCILLILYFYLFKGQIFSLCKIQVLFEVQKLGLEIMG